MVDLTRSCLAAIEGTLKVGLVIVGVFAILIFFLLILKYGSLWLQARLSRAPVSFAELIGMTLRKVDARVIVISRIMAAQRDWKFLADLEALPGGRTRAQWSG